ncbi:prolyl aminopeptidase [Methylonatrum kenyense]|uniref:prolyl aminopeptidase n=1 Tax=Methylonatrum kenyense TaxID=455253 RepID=UPI0020BF0515|nr:prolyl aminopeptidase [Methylonatrum kenyense]MCK8515042.1 prolyl aminopeptidase [Methylonatrum kenyense]
MSTLYPATDPRRSGHLDVGDGHAVYWEESGTPDGVPVVFVHGGPGSGCSPDSRRYFDPDRYRVVLFDQRGAGKSRPEAEIRHNDSARLVADMEQLRAHLGIERWLLFGGSWGTTLALLYAQAHPERSRGLILRGVFLGRPQDIDWFYRDGTRRVYPEYWQALAVLFAEADLQDLPLACHRIINGPDSELARRAALAWSRYEGACATLNPDPAYLRGFLDPDQAWRFARICAHYMANRLFLTDNQILDHADRLRDLPGVIIHGRYDMICAPDQALTLHQAWPRSELQWIDNAGHSASEPGIREALVAAADTFASE